MSPSRPPYEVGACDACAFLRTGSSKAKAEGKELIANKGTNGVQTVAESALQSLALPVQSSRVTLGALPPEATMGQLNALHHHGKTSTRSYSPHILVGVHASLGRQGFQLRCGAQTTGTTTDHLTPIKVGRPSVDAIRV